MKELWENFIKKIGEFSLAKDKFETFCYQILKKHFPEKNIYTSDNLEKIPEKDNFFIIFLPLFFLDELKEHRKNKIRSELSKALNNIPDVKKRMYAFVICTPYELTDQEMQWWLNYRKKNDTNAIPVRFFDGGYLIELSKKYRIFDKWFIIENNDTNTKTNKSEKYKHSIEFIIPPQNNTTETEKNSPETHNIKKLQTQQENTKIENEKEPQQNEQDTLLDVKLFEKEDKNYIFLKSLYEQLKTKIEKLPKPDQKRYYDRIKEINIKKELFNFDEQDILKTINSIKEPFDRILHIYRNAKTAYAHQLYDEALFYYEILKKQDHKNYLNNKTHEIITDYKTVKNILEAIIYLKEGDYFFIQIKNWDKLIYKNQIPDNDQNNLITETKLFYEKAYKLAPNIKPIIERHCEFEGDLKLMKDQYKEAEICYKKAYETFYKKNIKIKYDYAAELQKAQKEKNIKRLKHLQKAYKIFSEKNKKKTNIFLETWITKELFKLALRAILILISITLPISTIIFITAYHPHASRPKKIIISNNINAQKIFESAIKNYKLTKKYPHLYDTALLKLKILKKLYGKVSDTTTINAYQRKIQKDRQNYINQMQDKILTDTNAYMISMRRPSEGLRFVKILFKPNDPKHGKYCYIDSNYNIIIPPFFDFDFRKLKGDAPRFKNGKAIVCIILSTGEKAFFIYNRHTKKIKRIKL